MRIHFNMRVFSFMSFEVDLQIPPCCEAIPTYVAFEGPLTCNEKEL